MADGPAFAKRQREGDDNDDHRPVKRSSYGYSGVDYSDTILVLIDSEEKRFTVPKSVICSKSKFFRAACSERWKEGQEKTIRLPEVEAMLFQRYVDWAHRDILVYERGIHGQLTMLAELYLLADKLDDVKLRNKVILAMATLCEVDNKHPNVKCIKSIWNSTTTSSPLRKWVIDIMMLRSSRLSFEQDLPNFPAELTQQIALKFMQQSRKANSDFFQAKLSEYMEAEEAE